MKKPLVGVVMGSDSDWKVMSQTVEVLKEFGVPHEARVVSAHRTPDLLFEYAETAEERGLQVIIAGAGGAAQPALPVFVRRRMQRALADRARIQRLQPGIDLLRTAFQQDHFEPLVERQLGAIGRQRQDRAT